MKITTATTVQIVMIYCLLHKVWMGNTDGLGIKTNMFDEQVQARYIRIFPLTYNYKMCMKLELFGCRKSKGFYLAQSK